MTMTTPLTKLVITKNKRVIDNNGMFTYRFDFFNNDEVIFSEIRKIDADEMMLPKEDYSIEEKLDHKIDIGHAIDKTTFIVEEVEV